jgi:protein-disulfide isomerase
MNISFVLALAGGSWIFIGVIVVLFFAVVFGYYTRRGSGINQHPYADRNASSGPEAPSELAHDRTQNIRNWDRGVGGSRRPRVTGERVHLADEALRAALQAWRAGPESGTLAQLDGSTPVRGPDDGAEVIVFWDYLAPGASTLAAALSDLRTMRPVREAALQLPIADARPLSYLAALAVEAARDQGQFWAAHERLLERPPKDEEGVLALSDLVDDPQRFRAAVEDGSGRDQILADIRLAGASGVAGVPTVFIGSARYYGEPDAQELAVALENPAARPWEPRIPRAETRDERAVD